MLSRTHIATVGHNALQFESIFCVWVRIRNRSHFLHFAVRIFSGAQPVGVHVYHSFFGAFRDPTCRWMLVNDYLLNFSGADTCNPG